MRNCNGGRAGRREGVKINVMQFWEGGRVNVINYLCS